MIRKGFVGGLGMGRGKVDEIKSAIYFKRTQFGSCVRGRLDRVITKHKIIQRQVEG